MAEHFKNIWRSLKDYTFILFPSQTIESDKVLLQLK